jgi:hypothetical protein
MSIIVHFPWFPTSTRLGSASCQRKLHGEIIGRLRDRTRDDRSLVPNNNHYTSEEPCWILMSMLQGLSAHTQWDFKVSLLASYIPNGDHTRCP